MNLKKKYELRKKHMNLKKYMNLEKKYMNLKKNELRKEYGEW